MLAAAEAVIEALGWTDCERRCFFVVKRAAGFVLAARFLERYTVSHNLNNIGASDKVVDEGLRYAPTVRIFWGHADHAAVGKRISITAAGSWRAVAFSVLIRCRWCGIAPILLDLNQCHADLSRICKAIALLCARPALPLVLEATCRWVRR